MGHLSRRTMLKMAGGAALGGSASRRIFAVLSNGTVIVQDHRVPADKGLAPDWLKGLTERGTKEVWTGEALEAIGMPCGGIATGQLYLCGDGTLGVWEIFNHHEFQSQGPYSYAKRAIPHLVEFGFKLNVDGQAWKVDKTGFRDVSFKGEYPIGTIEYRDPGCPIAVESVAYSPFIPLNALDSGLPATVFEIELTNASNKDAEVELAGFLENAVGRSHTLNRLRHTAGSSASGLTMMVHSADPGHDEFDFVRDDPRADLSLADFDGDTYGDWKAEGAAFGSGPVKGTLPDQQPVIGFVGSGYVNSYQGGDDATGHLTSPDFTIERDFINFKIGGGNHPGRACINLVIEGKIVRTATGLNDETLLWDTWAVKDFAGKTAHIQIVDTATGGWGHINIDQIGQSDRIASHKDLDLRRGDPNRDNGTMALACMADGTADDRREYGFDSPYVGEVKIPSFKLKPGEKRTIPFILAWHFPNHPNGRNYANRFEDAGAVARYIASNHTRLSRDTKLWRDTYYDSTLPYWLLDRLHATIGNLCTGTTEWWKSGRFWSWEGVVCCSGTCTHVWNYEHSMARLFPELERNVRVQQDFGAGFDPATGLVGFRSDREYAADGQCGTILKAYREHLTNADDKFLKKVWPRVKAALEFLIRHDANGDGIIEDAQPNTYDIDFFGANTFVGSLYLAALRAGEEMAREMGDAEFRAQCRKLFESGRDATMKRLWNGEYFIQEVDEAKFPEYQYGPGCLADQLFGQGWAHQVALGRIYPRSKTVQGLKSIWKYNWAPDVAGQNKRWPPQRPFALPGEAGLFTCTWPSGGREKEPVLYRDEVWTGIEYQVAGHMIWEGLVEEGLAMVRAVHERYHPLKRNPYNEVECSDHYSRAMASWGVYTALCGFEYHGPAGRIAFDPRVTPEHFRAAFTTAEGWGTFLQNLSPDVRSATLSLKHGTLRLAEIGLSASYAGDAKVTLRGKPLEAKMTRSSDQVTVQLGREVRLKAGDELVLKFSA